MKKEFEISLATCEEIWLNKAGWEKLFETPNFFVKYKHFIVLEASANSEEDQVCMHITYVCNVCLLIEFHVDPHCLRAVRCRGYCIKFHIEVSLSLSLSLT